MTVGQLVERLSQLPQEYDIVASLRVKTGYDEGAIYTSDLSETQVLSGTVTLNGTVTLTGGW